MKINYIKSLAEKFVILVNLISLGFFVKYIYKALTLFPYSRSLAGLFFFCCLCGSIAMLARIIKNKAFNQDINLLNVFYISFIVSLVISVLGMYSIIGLFDIHSMYLNVCIVMSTFIGLLDLNWILEIVVYIFYSTLPNQPLHMGPSDRANFENKELCVFAMNNPSNQSSGSNTGATQVNSDSNLASEIANINVSEVKEEIIRDRENNPYIKKGNITRMFYPYTSAINKYWVEGKLAPEIKTEHSKTEGEVLQKTRKIVRRFNDLGFAIEALNPNSQTYVMPKLTTLRPILNSYVITHLDGDDRIKKMVSSNTLDTKTATYLIHKLSGLSVQDIYEINSKLEFHEQELKLTADAASSDKIEENKTLLKQKIETNQNILSPKPVDFIVPIKDSETNQVLYEIRKMDEAKTIVKGKHIIEEVSDTLSSLKKKGIISDTAFEREDKYKSEILHSLKSLDKKRYTIHGFTNKLQSDYSSGSTTTGLENTMAKDLISASAKEEFSKKDVTRANIREGYINTRVGTNLVFKEFIKVENSAVVEYHKADALRSSLEKYSDNNNNQ